jgi:hypothetical protein
VLQLLAARVSISAGVYEYSVRLKTKGAPVDWIGLEPVITYTVACPSRRPGPAAKLFIEWLLSKEDRSDQSMAGCPSAMTSSPGTARFSSNTSC